MTTTQLLSDALLGSIDNMEVTFIRAVVAVIFVAIAGGALLAWLWPRDADAPDVCAEAAGELAYPAPADDGTDDDDEDETPPLPAATIRPQRDVPTLPTLPTLPAFPAFNVGSGSPAEINAAAWLMARMDAMSGDDPVIVPVMTPCKHDPVQDNRSTYCPTCIDLLQQRHHYTLPWPKGVPRFCRLHASSRLARAIAAEWSV